MGKQPHSSDPHPRSPRARSSSSRIALAACGSALTLALLFTLASCSSDSGSDSRPTIPDEPADVFIPEPIELSVSKLDFDVVELSWISPHDEPDGVPVARYDLRRFTQPITPANWDSATTLSLETDPKPEGSVETYVDWDVSALSAYHYAIRSFDAAGNASLISPSVVATTTCRPTLLDFSMDQDLCPGLVYTIRWEAPPCAGGFRLELHHEGDRCYDISGVLPAEARSFDWRAIRCAHEQANHSIVLRTTEGQWVRSGALNLVDPCSIQIGLPPDGCQGESMKIEWTTGPCCGDSVSIELEAEGSGARFTVTPSHPNDGAFDWEVERFEGLDRWATLLLTDLASRETFRKRVYIERTDCQFDVTQPGHNEAFAPGMRIPIAWDGSCCSEFVDLVLLRNGIPCRTIAEGVPNSGSFLWTDTDGCDSQRFGYAIRVSGVDETTGRSKPFSISDQCVILPAASYETTVYEGYSTPIRWSTNGVCETVNIELLFRSVFPCATIAENEPNDGYFEWTPALCPEAPRGEPYRIKIYSPGSPTDSYLTPAFTIVPHTIIVRANGSGDYRTIRAALDASRSGNVLLEDGVFTGIDNTSFEFGGNVSLRSESGDPTRCILDGDRSSGLRLSGRTITIEGIQFRNFSGGGWHNSGVALHVDRSPSSEDLITLDHCIFRGNRGDGDEVSVVRLNSSSVISRCVFSENVGFGTGVITYRYFDNPVSREGLRDTVKECTFHANGAAFGTIVNTGGGGLRIEQVLFAGNTSPPVTGSNPVFVGCTNSVGDPRYDWTGAMAPFAGQNANLSSDPQFCDPPTQLLHVRPTSPNLPQNNACNRLIGASGVCPTNP